MLHRGRGGLALRAAHRRLAALALAVGAAHLLLIDRLLPDRFGFGAADTPRIARLDVAFVRELAPAVPVPLLARRASPLHGAYAPARAASAALEAARPAEPPLLAAAPPALPELGPAVSGDPPALGAPDVAPAVAAEAASAAVAAAAAASAAASPASAAAAAFEWPPSTRLTYRLEGWFRGPVEGQARVEWLASGSRYQVHLDVSVGPPFAPLVARTLSSEGRIAPEGLVPLRYVEETRVALREPRRLAIALDADAVRLPGGRQLERPAGVQDSASQFVHMTWLFTVRPELLEAGRTIEFPLALPRRVDRWVYEVVGPDRIATPAGTIDAVHVRPRRDVVAASRRSADLAAEFWVAPMLQNLPVRIVIRQDDETWVDLTLERLPQQAERR